ncbi:MAG: hypothetical protein KBD66_00575, partial [Candidatus Doudnabacteria bacterium]|nr:hypothetical protein [Candidatus Doudnabacteria bacterium]
MGRQTISVNSKILLAMLLAGDMPMRFNGRLLTSPQYPWLRSDRRLLRMLRYLHHKGYVVWEDTAATRLIKITSQGKLKSLLDAFDVDMSKKWDGKWRVVVYDIPEATSALRFQLIHQLHHLRFKKLQASVYIS